MKIPSWTLKLLFLICIINMSFPVWAEDQKEIQGIVVDSISGDTLVVSQSRHLPSFTVKIWGITAPPASSIHGKMSLLMGGLGLNGQLVYIKVRSESKNQIIGDVICGPKKVNYGHMLVEEGLAQWNKQEAPNDTTFQRLEQSARANHKGMWGSTPTGR